MDPHEEAIRRVVASRGVTLLVGGLDTGKTTLARRIARAGLGAGLTVGFLDADVGQSTVGPPTAVGLRICRQPSDLEHDSLARADVLAFVGSISPQGHLLPLVVATRMLLDRAHAEGCDMVVVDTTGLVSGVYGQLLKGYKVQLLQPDHVIGVERGSELAPVLGVVRRFSAAQVEALKVHPDVIPTSVEQRALNRQESLRRYFAEPLQRWRIKPAVFLPTLPDLFDLASLDHILVGLSDGKGGTIGIGYLEHVAEDGGLRLVSPASEGPKALVLGSVRLEEDFRGRRVELRNLLGSD
ncbi:MAG TPA: Clp1/GlmU family protein [Actinomycetota bacterium]|nr:Clp1/GlmU family protein [Actinomycetota bacterium]